MASKSKQAFYWLMGLLLIVFIPCQGQDQRIADSLTLIYQKNALKGTEKLELLRNLTFNENDAKLALRYAEELIELSKLLKDDLFLYRGYFQKGNKTRLLGRIDQALAAYFSTLKAS